MTWRAFASRGECVTVVGSQCDLKKLDCSENV